MFKLRRNKKLSILGHFLWRYKYFSFTLIVFIIALALQFSGFTLAAHWALGVASLISVVPLAKGMWEDFRHGQFGLDILALTAIVTAVLLHEYWAAIIVVLMLTGGESLEDFAEHRAQADLRALLERAPQQAHVLRGSKTIDVAASTIQPGDKLMVKPGELVPVDGNILEGEANFDESSLTGESLPVAKTVGESVVSGSVNLDGAITLKATHSAADSQYQQINKSPTRFALRGAFCYARSNAMHQREDAGNSARAGGT